MSIIKTTSTALALLGTMALGAPASAAPVMSSTATLGTALSTDMQQVQWRGRHHHRGWGGAAAAAGIGLAAGALIGSAASSHYGPYGYYGAPYAYGPGVYAGPGYVGGGYYAAPAYRGYPGCDRVDSSGVTRFDNCY